MLVAKGDWILFIDADDFWIFDNTLAIFDRFISSGDYDIVRSKSLQSKSYSEISSFNGEISATAIGGKELFMHSGFSYTVWSSAYNRQFLINNTIWFTEGMFYEDTVWNTLLMSHNPTVAQIDFPFYGYFENPQSTTRTANIRSVIDNVHSCFEVMKIGELVSDSDLYKCICNRICGTIISLPRQLRDFPLQQSLKVLAPIRDNNLIDRILLSDISINRKIYLEILKHIPKIPLATYRYCTLLKRYIRSQCKLK